MVPPNKLVVMYLLLTWPILVFVNFDFASSRVISNSKHDELPPQGDCVNCTICPYPCRSMYPPLPPSSVSGYPLYGAPPPPSSGYQSYPPPRPPEAQDRGNCTPVSSQCCQYPPPAPPNTYTYLPSDSISPTPFPSRNLFSVHHDVSSFICCFLLVLSLHALFSAFRMHRYMIYVI